MVITNSNASHCHVNTKVQSTDLVQMKNMNFRVCVLVRLLFGHQAVNPYRVNTACAPMAAYTWTPSRNPWARIPPCPCYLLGGLYCYRDLDGPDTVFVHWDPTVEGWGVTSAPRQGSSPCRGEMGLPPLFGGRQ